METQHLAPLSITYLGTGSPARSTIKLSFVERARCPFLRMVQDISGDKFYIRKVRVLQLQNTIVLFC
ncbi:hypothetical protein QUA54_21545 [Microcoleus sp. MOSTC5]|uniref:hypothetical protein n=1 Tax=Microcoleus sp. MOSTC5 TaxID=3055378 RepID=UPI002FD75DCB